MNLVLVVLIVLDAEIQSMRHVNLLDTRSQSGEAVREEEQLVKNRSWRDKRVIESMEITIATFAVCSNNLGVEVEFDSCDFRQQVSFTRAAYAQGGTKHFSILTRLCRPA